MINIPSWGVFRYVDIRDGFNVPDVLKDVEKSQNSVGILSSAQSPFQKWNFTKSYQKGIHSIYKIALSIKHLIDVTDEVGAIKYVSRTGIK